MPISKATGKSVAPAAKGDLVVGSATNDAAVLGVGSADQVLTVDSSTTTGLKWAAASSGGLTLISEQTASAVTSLSFSSIPSTYKTLILTWQGIYHSTSGTSFGIRLNNDSSANYSMIGHKIVAYTMNTVEADATHCGAADVFGFGTNIQSSTNRVRSAKGTLIIYDYASTSKHKYMRVNCSHFDTAAGTYHLDIDGTFPSTSAISSIDIVRISGTANFSNMTNTSIRLYGLS